MPPVRPQFIEANTTFRFTVAVKGVTYAAFTECKLPTFQVEVQEVKEGGQNTYIHKLPVRVNAGTVTLRNGITRNGALLRWYFDVLEGKIADGTREVKVLIFDVAHKPMMTWVFQNAYPIKWVGPTLKTDDRAIAVEEIEIAHHGFTVEGSSAG